MLAALKLGLLALVVVGDASRLTPCNNGNGRSLLQELDDSARPNPAGFMSDTSNSGTLVQTMQVEVLQEMCIVTFNSYFRVGENQMLNDPADNLQQTAEDCCAVCSSEISCNAWQWCASNIGCALPGSDIRYPYLGCQLLKIASFSPYVQGFSPLRQGPPDLPFIAGAPFNMTLPQIPGYTLTPGTDVGGLYDFPCSASSVAESCMVLGQAEELGKLCMLDELCQAFVYFPDGVAFDGSGPVGILKSSGDAENPITSSELNINPTGATYLRQYISNEEDAAGARSGTSSGTIIGAVVGSVVGLALLATLVGLLVIAKRKYTRMAAANAELEKRSNSDSDQGLASASGSRDGSESSSEAGLGSGGGGRNTKALTRQHSPPSVVDANGGGGRSRGGNGNDGDSTAWNGADPFGLSTLENVVVVSEVTNINNSPPITTTAAAAGAGVYQGGRGMAPGSSARELLEAFSQMYAHRPPVDYVKLAEMLEDEEAVAAAEREEAQEASYRESETTSNLSRSSSLEQQPFEVREESEEFDFINAAAAAGTGQRTTTITSSATPSHSLPPQEGVLRETPAPLSQEEIDAWAIQPEDVEVCRRPDGSWWQLGTGAFGTVYRGLYCGKDNIAIKVLHRLEEPRHTEAFAREIALLKTLRDRHIVQFLGASLNGPQGTAMLITELMELGDLWRALPARDSHEQRIFSWNRRGKRVMQDVARGLRYLHSKRIIHFDLKSANILLSRAGTAKLADIGMARVLHKSYLSMVSSGLGTFAWSAPEVLAGRRCGCKADIYSWGVVLWEVCTGEAPVRGVMRTLDPERDACPVQVVDLYTRCVAENPDERPTADEILEILEKMG
ncbi:hypothetical protein Ndes2526A_g02333 [Nannochloris sp. 'desiccata']